MSRCSRSLLGVVIAAFVMASAACHAYETPPGDYACERLEDCTPGWRCVVQPGAALGVCEEIDGRDAVEPDGAADGLADDDPAPMSELAPDTLDGRWFASDGIAQIRLQLDQTGLEVTGDITTHNPYRHYTFAEGALVGHELTVSFWVDRTAKPSLFVGTLTYDPDRDELAADSWQSGLTTTSHLVFSREDAGPPLPPDTLDGRWATTLDMATEAFFELDQTGPDAFTGTAGDESGLGFEVPIEDAVLIGHRLAFAIRAQSADGTPVELVVDMVYEPNPERLYGWWVHSQYGEWTKEFLRSD